MADKKVSSSNTNQSYKKLIGHYISILDNKYLLVKDFVALSFFVAALLVMSPLSLDSQITSILLSIYGIGIIFICLWIIASFFIKTACLQLDPKVKRYSAIVSLNSFFGFSMPLLYINIVLGKIIFQFLGSLPSTGSLICQFRHWVTWFLYQYIGIDSKLDVIFMFSILLALAVFMIGGVWERSSR